MSMCQSTSLSEVAPILRSNTEATHEAPLERWIAVPEHHSSARPSKHTAKPPAEAHGPVGPVGRYQTIHGTGRVISVTYIGLRNRINGVKVYK